MIDTRRREDIIVGDEIVRHRLSSRLIHWGVALSFFLCLFTGLPIWTPIFGWMASFFGGLSVCRWLHPILGLVFFGSSALMIVHWFSDMKLEKGEGAWFGPKLIAYLRYRSDDSDTGKYNGGQKIFFWASGVGAVVLLATGLVLWFPVEAGVFWSKVSILLHDLAFIGFFVAIVVHIYLGTAAEPGTFGAMIRGTVSKTWAKFHHPRWVREISRADE